jgi:hypothetical protein
MLRSRAGKNSGNGNGKGKVSEFLVLKRLDLAVEERAKNSL